MSWDEDELHRWIARASAPRALVGSQGHDAAVTARPKGRLVSCHDQCVEGVHAELDVRPEAFGGKAVRRALSDLAATAATARGVLLGLSAPRDRATRWMRGVITGARRAAEESGAEVWGGDLAAAPGPARLGVTALGEASARTKPVGRDRARVGQLVVCTGPVGGSILGRHLRFTPRLDAGRRLAAAGATAMMDVSDGLAWDLYRMSRASRVRIELDHVPVHADARRLARRNGESAIRHALHDGEDHELLATLTPADAERAVRAARARGEPWCVVGRVTRGAGLRLVGDAAAPEHADARTTADARRGENERAPLARDWTPDEGGWRHGR